jgi:hypothetical protein
MSVLLTLVVLVVVFALLYWLITSAPIPGPMGPVIKWALSAILIIIAVFTLLNMAHVKIPFP